MFDGSNQRACPPVSGQSQLLPSTQAASGTNIITHIILDSSRPSRPKKHLAFTAQQWKLYTITRNGHQHVILHRRNHHYQVSLVRNPSVSVLDVKVRGTQGTSGCWDFAWVPIRLLFGQQMRPHVTRWLTRRSAGEAPNHFAMCNRQPGIETPPRNMMDLSRIDPSHTSTPAT